MSSRCLKLAPYICITMHHMGKNIFICGLEKQFSLMEKSSFRLTPTSPELRYHPFELKFQQDQLVAFKSNRRPDKNLLKILNSVKKFTSYFFCFVFRFKGSFFFGCVFLFILPVLVWLSIFPAQSQ